MKILIITPYFAPAWGYGGPPKINYELAKEIAKRGFDVEVWTTDALDENRNKITNEVLDKIRIIRFKNISNYLAWNHKIFIPLGFNRYSKKNIEKFDFVFITDLRDSLNPIVCKHCLKEKVPYSISAYGQIPYDNSIKKILKIIYDRLFGAKIIKNAKYLFGQTLNELQMYQDYFNIDQKQLALLPLGIDYKSLKNYKNTSSFRKKYKISKKDKVILFVGRINYLKGIDITINIFYKIQKIISSSKLVIVGRDDGFLNDIKNQVSELKLKNKIIITKPLYGKDSYPAYLESDLFLFTPRFVEETSLATLTSLALGTPVLTVKQAQIPFLKDYKAGRELDLSSNTTDQTIYNILCNNKLLNQMSKNGIRLIKDKYDIPKIADKLIYYIQDKQNVSN